MLPSLANGGYPNDNVSSRKSDRNTVANDRTHVEHVKNVKNFVTVSFLAHTYDVIGLRHK